MPFTIVRNDITKMSTDAIVNTANPLPVVGGGTDRAVYRAAGEKELLDERRKIGRIEPGDAAITGAYRLQAKYIIHTVGPAWVDGKQGEYQTLASCYTKSLRLAAERGCASISFPMIATGVYGFPKDKALSIAVSAISSFLIEHEMEVYLVVFDPESFQVSSRIRGSILEFIDDHYVCEAEEEEYGPGDGYRNDVRASITGTQSPEEERINALHRRQEMQLRREWSDRLGETQYAGEEKTVKCTEVAPGTEELSKSAAVSEASASYVPHPIPELDISRPPKYDELVKHLGESFRECLFRLIDERNLKDSEVYKRANISKKVFSKIRISQDYTPKKGTILALAVSLKLDMDETQDLLSKAGYAFQPGRLQDLIIASFIRRGSYDINEINLYLFDAGEDLLGSNAV